MANKPKKPDMPAAAPSAEQSLFRAALSTQNLQDLAEVLGRVSASQQGLKTAEFRDHVADVKTRVESIAAITNAKANEQQQREQAATQVDALVDALSKVQHDTARALAPHLGEIRATLTGADLGKMSDGLRLLASWLRAPTPERSRDVQQLMIELRGIVGTPRSDAERKAEIEAMVKKSFAEVFSKPPTKPAKP